MITFKELLYHYVKKSGKSYRQLASVLGVAHTFIARAGEYDIPFKRDMLQQVIRSVGGIPEDAQVWLHYLAWKERQSEEDKAYIQYLSKKIPGFNLPEPPTKLSDTPTPANQSKN